MWVSIIEGLDDISFQLELAKLLYDDLYMAHRQTVDAGSMEFSRHTSMKRERIRRKKKARFENIRNGKYDMSGMLA